MPDYQKGHIYIIKNTINDYWYIGSTTQTLHNRWKLHINNRLTCDCKFYQAMNEIGYKNFYPEPLEPYPCKFKWQLHAREKHWIKYYDTINNGYNERLPSRTNKEYRQDNAEQISKQRKEKYENNREEILEQQKQDRINNPEKYKERNKKTYKKNKDNEEWQQKKQEWQKQDRTKNPEKYKQYDKNCKEKNNIEMECICGSVFKRYELFSHLRSEKHCAFLFNQLPFYQSRKDLILEDRNNKMKVKDILIKYDISQSTYYNIIHDRY